MESSSQSYMSTSQQNSPAELLAASSEGSTVADRGTTAPETGDGEAADGGAFGPIRRVLLLKRSELLRQQSKQLDSLHAADKHHLADLDEMSSDASDTDSLCALVDMESQTLEQIEAALNRIEAGSYGRCEGCEEPIPSERLEVLPFAPLCVGCQQRAESEPGFLDELAERHNESEDEDDDDDDDDD